MKIVNLFLVCFVATVTAATAYGDGSVAVDVVLNPAGNFKAETNKVKGHAYKTKDGFAAENVIVDIRSLETGVKLRDKHTRERLGAPKNPYVKLVKASGKNGKGEALIEVNGKKQKVTGTYSVNGNKLDAQFKMNLPALGIKDISYMGVGVEEEVTVNVSLPVKPNRSTASKK